MAIVYTKQYRAVSDDETGSQDALSVRAIRDMETNINNYKSDVSNFPVINEIYMPHILSAGSGGTEKVIRLWAPRYIPDGYTKFRVVVGHYLSSGTATTWKIYACRNLYKGSTTFDSSLLIAGYDSDSIATSSGTHAIFSAADLNVVKSYDDDVYFLLTATDTSTSVSKITSISVWPMVS